MIDQYHKNYKENLCLRKIQKIGGNIYAITLPLEWITRFKIKKGDELYMEYADNGMLTVYPPLHAEDDKITAVTITVDKLNDAEYIEKFVATAYIYGIDKIKICSEKGFEEKQREAIYRIIERFVGLNIAEETNNQIEIDCMVRFTQCTIDKLILQEFELFEKKLNMIMADKRDEIIEKNIDADFEQTYYLAIRYINMIGANNIPVKCPATDHPSYIYKIIERTHTSFLLLKELCTIVKTKTDMKELYTKKLKEILMVVSMEKKYDRWSDLDEMVSIRTKLDEIMEDMCKTSGKMKSKMYVKMSFKVYSILEHLKENIEDIIQIYLTKIGGMTSTKADK